jgi:hypothetical protein
MVIFWESLWVNIPHAGEKPLFFADGQKFTP